MTIECIDDIPGAAALCDWYGGVPSFHDAKAELQINGDGAGWLKTYGFRMTNKVDEKGFFVLEKHFAATFVFEELKSVSLEHFMPGLAILGVLDVKKLDGAFEVAFFDTAYGVAGSIVSQRLSVKFEPDVRAP